MFSCESRRCCPVRFIRSAFLVSLVQSISFHTHFFLSFVSKYVLLIGDQSLQILRDTGVHTMRLMTNNPAKYVGLKGYGLAIVGRVPLLTPLTVENRRYLETKRAKMGHVYGHEDTDSTADDSSET